MSAQPKNGGPAFPHAGTSSYTPSQPGMDLLDWFAGQALQGLCASTSHDAAPSVKHLADYAWQQADAMLAERERRQQPAQPSPEQVSQWQPIETLPDDGRYVLAWKDGMKCPNTVLTGQGLRRRVPYTHWHPMPALPGEGEVKS